MYAVRKLGWFLSLARCTWTMGRACNSNGQGIWGNSDEVVAVATTLRWWRKEDMRAFVSETRRRNSSLIHSFVFHFWDLGSEQCDGALAP